VKVANVQSPAVAAGQFVSVALAVNEPMALESASSCWFTELCTYAREERGLGDERWVVSRCGRDVAVKTDLVDPALTPAIKVATTAPVPAVIFNGARSTCCMRNRARGRQRTRSRGETADQRDRC